MRSLGRLVRGLSALFWGLPMALIVCFHTAKAEGLKSYGIVPPLATTGLLVYGLWQLGDFQRQERVWRRALDWARVLALVTFGLSPFLYWYNRVPSNGFFAISVLVLTVTGLLLLGSLNFVLKRLGAMLPDEALRLEVRQFTLINLNLLGFTLLLTLVYLAFSAARGLPLWLGALMSLMERGSGLWFLVLMVLLPLAMTMALIWKTKEVILDSIFAGR
jgi:hypothetical protein